MPLVHVSVADGTATAEQRQRIGDGIYRALVDVASVPADDRFQVFHALPATDLIYSPDYMGFNRSPAVVFIQIFFNAGRTTDVKQALFARIAGNLAEVGIRGDDLVINLVDIPKENWSFGGGEMAYPPTT